MAVKLKTGTKCQETNGKIIIIKRRNESSIISSSSDIVTSSSGSVYFDNPYKAAALPPMRKISATTPRI